jgi:hypothetical protein
MQMVSWLTRLTARPKRPHETVSKYFQHQLFHRLLGTMGTSLLWLVLWCLSSSIMQVFFLRYFTPAFVWLVSSTFWHFSRGQLNPVAQVLRSVSPLRQCFGCRGFFWRKDKTGHGTAVPRSTTVPRQAGTNLVCRRRSLCFSIGVL